MDGYIFYGIMWFLAIYTCFFTNSDWTYRNHFLWSILLLIMMSGVSTYVGLFPISGAFLLSFCLFAYRVGRYNNRQIFSFVTGVCLVCLIVVSVNLLLFVHPVWHIFNDRVVQAVFVFLIVSLICKQKIDQLIIFVFGTTLASYLMSIVSMKLSAEPYDIHLILLDTLAILFFITFVQFRFDSQMQKSYL